ncbi:hypothetical protein ACH33_14965 [Aneurinibacillus sp. XH2]|uniref:hypothetical protein n=1 Tax=Aneurinibacillus sp. XH2 TaxID=1450761 RepID=UPI000709DBC7|nr:hypothetical protein [Aneurinibacillus sp. XH2]AMA74010.1 hypothetical protein ACH33_14965 [Aneurinibacillus sp. XH2]
MLIQVHRIDENGFYVEPVLIESEEELYETVTMFEETPEGERVQYTTQQKRADIMEIAPPEGLFRPRWVEGEWTEGLSQQEIDELTKPKPLTPSDMELLQQENASLIMKVAALEMQNEQQAQDQAALIMELTEKGVL